MRRAYTDTVGYEKGMTPAGEMEHIREAFARTATAIRAWPNPREARDATDALQALIRELQGEAAEFRGYLAACLMDAHGMTVTELAAFLGVSRPRASQIISAARERGNPVTEPLTLPEQPHVVLAVITSGEGVLVARRRDGIPPWTFPGGEILDGETSGDALKRRVREETGLEPVSVRFIGRRLHPRTSRVVVYGHVEVEEGEPVLGDAEDLAEVRWASIDETRDLMPDMYSPVRQYLDEMQRTE